MPTALPNSGPLCAHLTAEGSRRAADGARRHRSTGRLPPLGTWAEDHDLAFWNKVLNAPDGAGCSLTYVAPQVSADFVAKSQCTWWCWVLPDAISLSATVSAIIGGP